MIIFGSAADENNFLFSLFLSRVAADLKVNGRTHTHYAGKRFLLLCETRESLAANNGRALCGSQGFEKGELRLRAPAYESVYGCTKRNWGERTPPMPRRRLSLNLIDRGTNTYGQIATNSPRRLRSPLITIPAPRALHP